MQNKKTHDKINNRSLLLFFIINKKVFVINALIQSKEEYISVKT
jgi:hypothetical protein